MKFRIAFAAWLFSGAAFADSLPVITSSPTNTAATPGSTATLSVAATGAASYQWRFNGAEIADATNATLQVPNVQTNNSGYYLAIAKNVIGWVPSQMAWLSVVGSNGIVPFSNIANTNCYDAFGLFLGQAVSQITYQPINGSAQVMAGPALDQMAMVNGSFNRVKVTNGWFNPTVQVVDGLNFYTTNKTVLLPTVVPGQTVYYSVYITYTNNSIVCTQQSRVISMIAGGNGTPIPSMTNLMFPAWLEWPQDPWGGSSQTNQTCVAGETFTLSELWEGGDDCGQPTFQWRKDGVPLGTSQAFPHDYGVSSSCNAQLTISNAQPVDAGIYDLDLRGNNWFISVPIVVSIQTSNGAGVFQKPKFVGTNFICDVFGRRGAITKFQWSTNLSNWSDLATQLNLTGTMTFSNSPSANRARFYRTVLLP